MGSGSGESILSVLLRNFDVLALPVVSLLYPLYASIRAIETKSPLDDQQWLTYWVLYSMITLFELTFAKIIEWIPIWPYVKLILLCWLVIPYFSGAAYVYEHFVRPFFVNRQTVNVWYIPKLKDVFRKQDDILTAAEKYIEENGTEAFKTLISKAESVDREEQYRRSSNYMVFEDHRY
ncbi:HVA22-like protein a isoform X2 [Malania oleifera]|uniref:HVA22-like protein a isoform X2 n=1 Tax=Malania oleifera TaxID=397392 RepID=UPI0025ADFD94|nr:HVA22-like protein a isoform X2 [Malania oleifera]